MSAPARRCLRFTATHALALKPHSLEVTARPLERVAISGARAWGGFMQRVAACDRLQSIRAEACSSSFWRRFKDE